MKEIKRGKKMLVTPKNVACGSGNTLGSDDSLSPLK